MSQQPNVVYVQRPSNSMGMAGFIVSLVGYFCGGLLCPLGLVLSLIGLRKQPRGFAVAGVILGAIGTIGGIILFFVVGLAGLVACGGVICGGVAPRVVTSVHISATAKEIEQYEHAHGRLPATLGEISAIPRRSMRDGWDHPLRFAPDGKGGYTLSSDGPDGVPGNNDDIQHYHSAAGVDETYTPIN